MRVLFFPTQSGYPPNAVAALVTADKHRRVGDKLDLCRCISVQQPVLRIYNGYPQALAHVRRRYGRTVDVERRDYGRTVDVERRDYGYTPATARSLRLKAAHRSKAWPIPMP